MTARATSVEVPASAAPQRLDRFLSARLDGLSRSALGRLTREGYVRVDGAPAAKPGQQVRPGMCVEVRLPPEPETSPRPEAIPIRVLHEDADLVVVDKPACLVVHSGHGRREGTLVNALLGRGISLARTGAPERPGIVHRLDVGTSGVLVVAKTDRAHLGLCRAFAARLVDKRYRALVWGHPRPAAGRIERPIGRSRVNPTRMAVRQTRGRVRPARTDYDTVETMPGFALLNLALHTGRTHQIRTHLQSIHHPVVGDERYGGRPWRGVQDPIKRKALREFARLALHAYRLELIHPTTGLALRVEAPWPPELTVLLDILRRS